MTAGNRPLDSRARLLYRPDGFEQIIHRAIVQRVTAWWVLPRLVATRRSLLRDRMIPRPSLSHNVHFALHIRRSRRRRDPPNTSLPCPIDPPAIHSLQLAGDLYRLADKYTLVDPPLDPIRVYAVARCANLDEEAGLVIPVYVRYLLRPSPG